MKKCILSATACVLLALPAAAQDQVYENCQWGSNEGRMTRSYDFVGPAACEAYCEETEGCTAWYYQPHTFNPETAPGGCGLYGVASDPMPHDREFCGSVAAN